LTCAASPCWDLSLSSKETKNCVDYPMRNKDAAVRLQQPFGLAAW
jgi:hypothetical protein